MSRPPYFQERYRRSSGKPYKVFVVVHRNLLNLVNLSILLTCERLVNLAVYLSLAYVEQIAVSSLAVSDALPDMLASYATPRQFVRTFRCAFDSVWPPFVCVDVYVRYLRSGRLALPIVQNSSYFVH